MKIEFKLTPPQVIFLWVGLRAFVEQNLPNFSTSPKMQKLLISQVSDLSDKLERRAKPITQKAFSKNKPIKVTLSYHDAEALKSYLKLSKDKNDGSDVYFENMTLQLFNLFDQKLS